MTTKTIAGVPVGGLKTVGQIIGTNDLLFHTGQNGLAVAVELLSTHTPGAPVVDDRGEFIGLNGPAPACGARQVYDQ
jgi:CBS domain-containing protein